MKEPSINIRDLVPNGDQLEDTSHFVVERLAGGVISGVKALLRPSSEKGAEPAPAYVVKMTSSEVVGGQAFTHHDSAMLAAASQTHCLDAKLLQLLQDDPELTVPTVYGTNDSTYVTIMADFRAQGYRLLQDNVISDRLNPKTARNIGRSLAILQKRLSSDAFKNKIVPVEDSQTQIRERLHELQALLYGNLDRYREIEASLIGNGSTLLYTDGHPKNIAVNDNGDVLLFDFGRLIYGSEQYPPANFCGQIGLAIIAGAIDSSEGIAYIRDVAMAYNDIIPIDDRLFVSFFIAELVHRGLAMRWIDKRIAHRAGLNEVKLAVHATALRVFDEAEPIETINELCAVLQRSARHIAEGACKILLT